jgi:serine/threonine protein kinase
MGVVYKAQDQRLDRVVALKVIRDLPSDPDRRRRFRQEARAAAQVSHPNACQIYDLVEEDDGLFLVMEYIEGESLDERMKQGALPAREAAQLVLGMLSALGAFHKAGIVHRDLKPANVISTAEGTKILDFGIAKQIGMQTGETQTTVIDSTMPGMFLGTPRYASPEQFREHQVDARSDIFSIGVIFYEMLVGQSPFPGTSFSEVAHAVLQGSPPALAGSPAIATMGRIVHRALAREPRERYQTAEAMAGEIRAALAMDGLESRATAHPVRRLMVLPFRILRPSEEIQFLAFSLPEAITVSLAGLEDLVVRSSIMAAQYSSDSPDLKRIAKEAEVDVVLTGALLHVGEQLRITTQLVDAASGTLLWSHASQGTIRQLLQLHDELVKRIVDSMLPSVSPREHQALQQDRPASGTVYELYLRANELSRKWEDLPTAIQQYEHCVALDPSYASAWARLGRARWLLDKYTRGSIEGLQSADDAFQAAFRLNPGLPLAHNFYTALQVDQGRTLEALRRLLDRVQTRRNDPELFAGLAHVCRYCGLLHPAVAAHQEARRLDPQIPTTVNHTYFMMGDYERALEAGRMDYGYGTAISLASLGRANEALEVLRDREQRTMPRLGLLYLTSLRTLLEGKREEGLAVCAELQKATFRDPEGGFYLARQLSFLGETESSLRMLTRAVENGFFCYGALIQDPWLDSLRGLPEFTEVLRKAHGLHREALRIFGSLRGDTLLGLNRENY